eukprot:gene15104-16846_t
MLFFAFVVVLVVCWSQVGALTYNPYFPTGQCLTLPSDANYRLINPCAGVVNYQYFSFGTLTPKFLETKAKSLLSSALLPQLSQTALNNLVRLTCSNLYLKCADSVVPSDPTTYNYEIYQTAKSKRFGVPFYRPCISVCAPFAVQTQANALLSVAGSLPSCTGTFDYSYTLNTSMAIPTYDSNTTHVTQGKCFVPATRSFAIATQPYVNNGGPCDGFVGSTFFTPFGNVFNSSFAVVQSTGVPRVLLDAAVKKSIPTFPPFVTEDCRKSFKQYVCYSAYFNPAQVTVLGAIQQNNINTSSLPQSFTYLASYVLNLPEYPDYEVCTHFVKSCATILKTSGAKINCTAKSATSTVGARAFPEQKQAVASVALTSLGVTLKVYTEPNSNGTYNATADATSYATSCPSGFVIPDDPNNPDVQWVTGTACAIPCRAPLWTHDEWDYYKSTANHIPIAGTVFGMLCLIYILYTKTWEENYLMIAYNIVALVASTQSWNFIERGDFDDRMCIDNAVNFMQKYRHGPCVTQGVILHFCFMACSAILLCMAVERMLVHHKLTDWTRHPVYLLAQLLLVFFYPIIPVVVVAANNAYGFSKTQGVCFILSSSFGPRNFDTGLGGLTVFVTWGAAFIVMILSRLYLWQAWVPLCPTKETSGKWKSPHHGVTCMDVLRGIDPYFAVIWGSVFVFVPYFAIWGQIQLYQDGWLGDYRRWVQCVFQNWDGSTDSSWEDACGDHVDSRPSNVSNPFLDFALTSNMIIIGTIFIIFHSFHHYINEPEKRYNALPSSSKKSGKSESQSAKEEVGPVSEKSTGDVELVPHHGESSTQI